MTTAEITARYQYEEALEDACAAAFRGLGFAAYTQRSTGIFATPRYEFQFTGGAATDHMIQAADGYLPDLFRGSLRARIVTGRAQEIISPEHAAMRGHLREVIYRGWLYFVDLPEHITINRALESGSAAVFDSERDEDISEITFTVDFRIHFN